jgi:hypothetical protein
MADFPPEVPAEGTKIRIHRLPDNKGGKTVFIDCRMVNCEGVCIIHLRDENGNAVLREFLKYLPRHRQWLLVSTNESPAMIHI